MKYFVLVFALMASILGWSQELPFQFKGRVSNADNGSYESAVSVSVVQNGGSIVTTQTASSGKYNLAGTINFTQPFDIVFSKGGMVSKKVHFDFSKMNEEDIPPGDFRPVESLDIDIFAERENLDFSFLDNEPVANFDWDTRSLQTRLDAAGAGAMKRRIADLLAQAEEDELKNEQAYNDAIAAADAAYDAEKYEEALGKYEEALGYKPKEQYPSDKIVELDALIKAQKEKELLDGQLQEEYDNLISAADNLRDQGNWESAVSKYEEASQKKPSEQYPKDQIADLQAKIEQKKKEEENQAAYDTAVEKGEMFLKQNSLQAARDKFEEAKNLKPSEQLPKDRLAEIEEKLKDAEAAAEKKQKYDDAIAAADAAFDAEDFQTAKDKYEEALTFESASSYAKGRLQICKDKLAEVEAEQALQKQIEELLAAGQAAIDSKSYDEAIGKYDEVLGLDNANTEAQEKKALAEKLKKEAEEQAAADKEFNDLVKAGDDAVGAEDFETGISKYEAALALKEDQPVRTKLTDAQAKLQAQKDLAAKEEEFQKLIDEGNTLLGEDKLEDARKKFEEAQTLVPTHEVPPAKIAEIDNLLNEQKDAAEKKEKYEAAIAEADKLFDKEKWSDSKSKYEEALTFAEDPAYANGRIEEIGQKLAANEELAEQQRKYQEAISAADQAFEAKNWEDAKTKYEEALTLTDDKSYAKGRIDEVEAKLAELAAAQEQTERIDALLAEAKDLYDGDKLEDAKAKYEEVLGLDSKNTPAKDGIEQINKDLAALKGEAEREEAFKKLKEEGFELADEKKYDKAISKLQEALSMKEDAEVQAKIEEINSLKGEEQLAEEVSSLILDGEALFGQGKYEEAKDKFEEALAKDASSQEAKDGIEKAQKEIDAAQELASQDEKFEQLKNEGITLKDQDKYTDAKDKLNAALEIKDDAEVRKLIDEINKEESEAQALNEKEGEYTELMKAGDDLASAESYEEAIQKYEAAKGVKPEASEPDAKIAAVREQMKNAEEQAKIDQEYRELIDEGDKLVAEEKYLEAIEQFNKAIALKPTEQEPKDKADNAAELARNSKTEEEKALQKNLRIAEEKVEGGDYDRAEEILSSTEKLGPGPEHIAEIKELRERIKTYKKRDVDYAKAMEEAQKAYDGEKYQKALDEYRAANRLKPDEEEPKSKIDELEEKLDNLASSKQREKLYQEYMEKGERHQTSGDYEQALSDYQDALEAKAGDVAAQNKVNEIQQILDDLANKSAEERELKNQFNRIIGEADAIFNDEEYLKAKGKYEEALKIIPNDSYAKSRVAECLEREEKISRELADQQYQRLIEAADENFDEKDYDKAKIRYNNALSLRPNDAYPKDKLAEIEAILNPKTLASVRLEDPGVPISGSILDGQALLQAAQDERDHAEKQKIQNKFERADEEISDITAQKTVDREEARQEIVDQYANVGQYAVGADMERQENVETLRKAEIELNNAQSSDAQMDYNVNLSDQVQLEQINENISLNYDEREEVRKDNAKTMDAYEIALAKAFSEIDQSDYGSSIQSDQQLIKAEKTIRSEMIDDFEERDKVRQDVQDIESRVSTSNAVMNREDYEVNHEAKQVIEDVYQAVDYKTTEDTQIARDNNESVKDINHKVNTTSLDLGTSENLENYAAEDAINDIVLNYDSKAREDAELVSKNGVVVREMDNNITDRARAMNQQETAFAYGANDQIEGYKEYMLADLSGMDDNRKESVEILKEGNKELAKAQTGINEANIEKSQNNKKVIDDETTINGAIVEKAEEAHDQNVSGIEVLDQKARQDYRGVSISDEEERLNSQKGIADVYLENGENSTSSTDKQKENATTLDKSKKVVGAESLDRDKTNQEQLYGAADKIHNTDNTPKEKPIIANSLGEEYPEGVTEESFAQNDQNGLMRAIVTRRVVVIEGHADVYQRTQSLNAITYSKNGKPITEHVWNSETQGPHLVRHTK